jgi:hypothetical protein
VALETDAPFKRGGLRGLSRALSKHLLYAALKRCSSRVVLAAVVVFLVQHQKQDQRQTDRSVRLRRNLADRRIRGGNAFLGRRCWAGVRDPSTARDVHFVGVMLRSG